MNTEISKRIWVTRYFMVLGLVVLHLPPYQSLSELGYSFFDIVKAFFAHGMFRATVPVLTVMSGFLLFYSSLQTKPLKLLSKKVSSVLIPLIIWNIPFIIIIFVSQKYNVLSHEFSITLYPVEILNWVNAATGLFATPANYPLNFLRDLFAVALLSPLFWLFLKRIPYIGLIVVCIVYYFNLDGSFVLRNSMIVSFYIGALAACQKWDLTYLDRYAKWSLAILIVFCLAIALFDIENREPFRLISPFLVWPVISMFVNTRFGDFLYKHSKSSFFTFLSHAAIILILWFAYKSIPLQIPYFVYWLTAPVLTMFIAIICSRLFRKLLPKTASVVLGGR